MMEALLDVNVLVALLDQDHLHRGAGARMAPRPQGATLGLVGRRGSGQAAFWTWWPSLPKRCEQVGPQ